jgi:phosphoserine phosphatase
LLEELKKDNYYLLAISHSPKTVLDKFCINYGFDKVYGTIYEIGPEDKFTGEVTDEHLIMNKANILKRFVENNEFDLTESVAVGDTESDIPLLEWAQKPIAFNPNDALYKVAKLNRWKVVVERKDVIYNIQ